MLTDDQLLEFAKNWRCSHPGCAPWVDMTEDRFVNVARAIERASRRAALEDAATVVSDHNRKGREWVANSLWDTLANECADRIRALATETNNG